MIGLKVGRQNLRTSITTRFSRPSAHETFTADRTARIRSIKYGMAGRVRWLRGVKTKHHRGKQPLVVPLRFFKIGFFYYAACRQSKWEFPAGHDPFRLETVFGRSRTDDIGTRQPGWDQASNGQKPYERTGRGPWDLGDAQQIATTVFGPVFVRTRGTG